MDEKKHYFNLFLTDDGFVTNDDGVSTTIGDNKKTSATVGSSIIELVNKEVSSQDKACYGVVITYTVKPIYKDVFEL